MTDPTRFSDEEQARAALRDQAADAGRLDSAFTDQRREDQYPAPLSEDPVDAREHLFSRKSLFGWAIAALIFVFIIKIVLPVVFDTVKETIASKMAPPTHNTSVAPVVAPAPVAPTVAIPAIPEIPAIPAVPAPTAPAPVKKTTR